MIGGAKEKFGFQNCKEYNLGLWQCPSFLFVILGVLNMCAIIVIYIVVRRYDSPELVVGSVSSISILIFSIGASIIKGVEQMAKLNIAKSEFISIASHQLKAPLSGLRWSADLLLKSTTGELNEKQEGYVKDIQDNTSRMVRLVNDLLDVTRIDAGTMSMKVQDIDIKEIIEGVIEELRSYAKASNVEISFKSEKSIHKVKTDPIRLKMVIQNLIDNAIKYTGNKKGKVDVSLKKEGGFIFFTVRDNGVGISDEDKKHIFNKFFRGGGIVKTQTVGTGLGLYIAKAAIESSGGDIGFDSEYKKGSTFWFKLPSAIS